MTWLRILAARTAKMFHVKQSERELSDEYNAPPQGMPDPPRHTMRVDPMIALRCERRPLPEITSAGTQT
jgi:hypothetical protein